MPKVPVSVIIPVRNEEANLRECLASLVWADEIYVVDSQSTDLTVEIARDLSCNCVQFYYDGGWPKKKNWAIRNLPVRNEWILIVDADERISDDLRDELAAAIQRDDINGYYLRWQFIFLDKWMKHCWCHGWMLRLFRRGMGEYEDLGMRGEGGWDNEVHENIVVEGSTACLQSYLVHESNQRLSFWIRKQNEFSDWNAARRLVQMGERIPPLRDLWAPDPLQRRKLLKAIYLRLPGKPLLMFFLLYVIRKGFLDGKAGLYFCALRGAHELNVSAKVFELRLSRSDRKA